MRATPICKRWGHLLASLHAASHEASRHADVFSHMSRPVKISDYLDINVIEPLAYAAYIAITNARASMTKLLLTTIQSHQNGTHAPASL